MNAECKVDGAARLPIFAIALCIASAAACAQPPAPQHHAVAGLPFSQGRSFATLDDYLAFLERRGASDVPWYREIRPGIYELVSRRGPGAARQTFTREQLAKKFGFPG